ncbi:MAG TPA: hypothetical protein PLK34_00405 [Candidatus Pacearchaeota archaeon]|nr:hypothetical protein [Candidatus Pacearchaeota archaeon]
MSTPNHNSPNVDEILKRYGRKIEKQINSSSAQVSSVIQNSNYSKVYSKFKGEMAPEWSRYEKWCHSLGNIVKVTVSKKDDKAIRKHLEIAHLDVEPWQAATLSLMVFISVFFLGILTSLATFLINGDFPVSFFFLSVVTSLFLYYYVGGFPERFANKWRLKASSQMVPAILYVVVYMRHTPNLEKAIAFASEHLDYPLSLDLKKVFYDVEIGRYSTIKESLDEYLEVWRDYSPEFIEAFHLIESSLFEPSNDRRIAILEKGIQVVLDGVYERMLKFVHEVRSPIQNTYMLGTVLPVLGLALLPLASVMVPNSIKANQVFMLYNIIIPFLAFFLMSKYMMMRPGGYGETSLLERNPLYKTFNDNKHYVKAFLIAFPLIFLGLLPLIFQFTPLPEWLGIQKDFTLAQMHLGKSETEYFFGFSQNDEGKLTGPFGIGSALLGMFLPLGVALFFSISYKSKTKEMIIERKRTRELEKEFNSSLFQLGNRLGNGIPLELVFGRVAESSKGLKTEDFFKKVSHNIQNLGMSVERALFDLKQGALNYYPSEMISTSMKVLVEAAKKGLTIAAVSLMSISEYVKNIGKINDRLRDMLAETVSDMKSNMTFLTPLLAGVVVGLATMISAILGKVSIMSNLTGEELSGMGSVLEMLNVNNIIPPYYLQIAIGIYLIQIIFILTDTLVVIDAGEDKLEKVNKIGRNLSSGIIFYFIVAFFSTIVLWVLASSVLSTM